MVVTDLNTNNHTDLVLSSRAFAAMANKGQSQQILKLGIVDVEYKRYVYMSFFIIELHLVSKLRCRVLHSFLNPPFSPARGLGGSPWPTMMEQ